MQKYREREREERERERREREREERERERERERNKRAISFHILKLNLKKQCTNKMGISSQKGLHIARHNFFTVGKSAHCLFGPQEQCWQKKGTP